MVRQQHSAAKVQCAAFMSPAVRYAALGTLVVATGLLVWLMAGESREPTAPSLPDYTVAGREEVPELGIIGEVLVPAATRSDPDREELFRAIATQENLTVAFFFSSTEAVEAHRLATRDAAAQAALGAGFLGRLTRGEFTPGEEIFP